MPEEPIEGCTEHDVGWIMADFYLVMVSMYYYLRYLNAWITDYRRPPIVAQF